MPTYKAHLSVGTFRNVLLIPTGIVLKGLKLVPHSVFDGIPKKHFHLYALYKALTQLTRFPRFSEQAYIIHNHWSNGYYHWMMESLVRLLHISDPHEKILLIPENYPSFAFESLEILGIKKIHAIPPNSNFWLRTLEIPENPWSGYSNPSHLEALRERFFDKLGILSSPPHRLLYVSRRYATRRKVSNEEELLPILQKYGIEVIYAEKLSLKEQIFLFSTAKLIISIHGAGLTNVLFMPSGSWVLELYLAKNPVHAPYEFLACVLGHPYERLLCRSLSEPFRTIMDIADLIVDVKRFEKVLQRLLRQI